MKMWKSKGPLQPQLKSMNNDFSMQSATIILIYLYPKKILILFIWHFQSCQEKNFLVFDCLLLLRQRLFLHKYMILNIHVNISDIKVNNNVGFMVIVSSLIYINDYIKVLIDVKRYFKVTWVSRTSQRWSIIRFAIICKDFPSIRPITRNRRFIS